MSLDILHLCVTLAKGLTVATVMYVVGNVIYNLFLHPLRNFPGPLLYRASRIPYCVGVIGGTLAFEMLDLHNKYGPVVRVAPDELAFSDSSAWKEIMGHKTGGQEMGKWTPFSRVMDNMSSDIVNADREEHSRLRRQLSHGFSDKSMRQQEPMITQYIDLLIQRLRENCEGDKALNVAAWYNYTTFDIIGDLAFGEPFGCLEGSDYHPWVKMIFEAARMGTVVQSLGHYPLLKKTLLNMVPVSLMSGYHEMMKYTREKLLARMELGEERPDLIEGLLKKSEEWDMNLGKLVANANILVIAGSETTATLLSGVTYFLLKHPEVLSKLTHEVRSAFTTEGEINISAVSQLTYMSACLEETLRLYPPVAIGIPRVVPQGGGTISGHFVPENTLVAIHQWAMYHNEAHFTDPFGFHPERFLGDERFSNDDRDALQPFHVGPRNCLGKNLAYTEMRLILARVIFNFDMRLADESQGWLKQKVYNLWDKGPLYVHLHPR
ncbi:related to cytochrome P450 monooxygenase [Phialocephala subalpina]|uniref:Related to cytochrome P450 monooxygenase n=1 Tax=Phialocephala subalpina TaxID=576137 RepID=A0A1L7XU67_9HELO|nr:related to cytochrome P450 monooxygenase [Phialocephala subalpina]